MVARVGAPHGVHGQLKLHPFLDNPQLLSQFENFYLKYPHADWQTAPPLTIVKKGENFFVHFTGHDQREAAGLKYTHAELGVFREQLPELAAREYYWEDLVGLKVFNEAGQELGVIDRLMDTPAHDVLVIKNVADELLIPYVWEHYIISIDLNAKKMVVAWE